VGARAASLAFRSAAVARSSVVACAESCNRRWRTAAPKARTVCSATAEASARLSPRVLTCTSPADGPGDSVIPSLACRSVHGALERFMMVFSTAGSVSAWA